MANIMATGTAWFLKTLIAQASESVTYKRGANSVTVNAGIAETTARTINEQGFEIQVRAVDFLIEVDDLIILAANIKPDVGDTVTRTVNGETIIYEVLKTIDEKEYRESDRYGTIFRIHTKEISRT